MESFLRCIQRTADHVRFIDQTRLPQEEVWVAATDWRVLVEAIKALRVRGAPALGIAAACAAWLAAREATFDPLYPAPLLAALDAIEASRPTAVNLHHAVRRCRALVQPDAQSTVSALAACADELTHYEIEACRRMGANGLAHLGAGEWRILTVCNTGSLATVGMGTALAVVRALAAHGPVKVFACETRPLLQGARLTMWELMRDGLDCALITDGMAASIMRSERINLVLAGADRIAANGDAANKIGTFGLAVQARYFGIPFGIVAPRTTLDPALPSGEHIDIEQRAADEVRGFGACRTAPDGCAVRNPAFDVTPAGLISFIITDEGAHVPPYHFA